MNSNSSGALRPLSALSIRLPFFRVGSSWSAGSSELWFYQWWLARIIPFFKFSLEGFWVVVESGIPRLKSSPTWELGLILVVTLHDLSKWGSFLDSWGGWMVTFLLGFWKMVEGSYLRVSAERELRLSLLDPCFSTIALLSSSVHSISPTCMFVSSFNLAPMRLATSYGWYLCFSCVSGVRLLNCDGFPWRNESSFLLFQSYWLSSEGDLAPGLSAKLILTPGAWISKTTPSIKLSFKLYLRLAEVNCHPNQKPKSFPYRSLYI